MTADDGRKSHKRAQSRVPQRPASSAADLAVDRDRALALVSVSRETTARLDRFVEVFLAWQRRMNLIAPSTESTLWTRHIADSLQLLELMPHARIWADLGSGGGFPGLVVACALSHVGGARVHLIESNGKKAAFLRDAVRITGAPAVVHAERIEEFVRNPPEPIEVVTARALAPLQILLQLAYPLLKTGTQGLFLKGQDVEGELTEAAKYWNIQAGLAVSRTDSKARIVVVHTLEPKTRPTRGDRFAHDG